MAEVTGPLVRKTAAELSDLLRRGEVSAVEVTRARLDRIAQVDGGGDPKAGVHAFLHVATERALAVLRTPSDTPDPSAIPTVRDHQGYLLAVTKEGEQVRLALAPDPQGRALAAVFTHDDCFDAFASGLGGQLMMLNLPGRQLFEQLAETQLDGIVFNPAGPPAPVAFAAAFSRVILESGG